MRAMNLLSTQQAAERLGVSVIRVRQLIRAGKIKAMTVGRDYVIEEAALKGVVVYGKAGRPPIAFAVKRARAKAASGPSKKGKKRAAKKSAK